MVFASDTLLWHDLCVQRRPTKLRRQSELLLYLIKPCPSRGDMLTALYALVLLAAIATLVLLGIDSKLKRIIGAMETANEGIESLIEKP